MKNILQEDSTKDLLDKILILCERLKVFIDVINNNISLVKVYNNLNEEITNSTEYIQTFAKDSQFACEQVIFIEISKLFDSAQARVKGEIRNNCTFNRLKELLSRDSIMKEYIQRIDTLCKQFDDTSLKEIRNRMLAHHDEPTIDGGQPTLVPLSSISSIIRNAECIIKDIMKEKYGLEYSGGKKDDMYEQALKTMLLSIK